MRKYLLLLAAAALLAAPRPAQAGFVAVTGTDTVNTPDSNGNLMADVGEVFATTPVGGSIVSWTPDTPLDPQINNADLARYRYSLNGTVQTVDYGIGLVKYGGVYQIYYDLNDNMLNDDGLIVSTGNFDINASFASGPSPASLQGTLTQTSGPNNPSFADFGPYGPVLYSGTYTATVPGQQGTIQGTLTSRVPAIPEPGTMALLSAGLLPLLGLRRRK
jgi:hypothetical protein